MRLPNLIESSKKPLIAKPSTPLKPTRISLVRFFKIDIFIVKSNKRPRIEATSVDDILNELKSDKYL